MSQINPKKDAPLVWLLLGAKAGDNNQVLALAEALGWPWLEIQVRNQPWELLVNRWPGGTLAGVKKTLSSPMRPPWPDLVISAGRRNEPVAQWIRKQQGGTTRLVHIGRPWAPLKRWDLLVTTPQYFLPDLPNVLHNSLPLHRISPELVAEPARMLAPQLKDLPRPWFVVLLGGDSGQFIFTAEKARRMGEQVNALAVSSGGSVLVSDSRRTPAPASQAFLEQIATPRFSFSWGDQGENPYRALLGLADEFVVTGESMSMLAEAVAMNKPLSVFDMSDVGRPWWAWLHNYRGKPISHRLAMALGPRRMRRDIGRIQQRLVDEGRAKWLGDRSDRSELRLLANEAVDSAAAIKKLFPV